MIVMMRKLLNHIATWNNIFFSENTDLLDLTEIYQDNGKYLCCFQEHLSQSGQPAKYYISEIFKNDALARSINPNDLLIIGQKYGQYDKKDKQLFMYSYYPQNQIIELRNRSHSRKLRIHISEIVKDSSIQNRIHPNHITKIMAIYFIGETSREYNSKIKINNPRSNHNVISMNSRRKINKIAINDNGEELPIKDNISIRNEMSEI